MNRFSDRPASAARAQWLAELAQAIADAQRLARTPSIPKANCAEVEALYRRLELIRIEVEDLRRGSWGARPGKIDPRWTSLLRCNDRHKF